jgi:hypothetical protein
MTESEIYRLKDYLQEGIINHPRPFEEQPHGRLDKYLFCEDWEFMEILKYLIIGKEGYLLEPPPKRLKENPLWSQTEIPDKAEKLLAECGSAEKVIEYIRERRNGRNTSWSA